MTLFRKIFGCFFLWACLGSVTLLQAQQELFLPERERRPETVIAPFPYTQVDFAFQVHLVDSFIVWEGDVILGRIEGSELSLSPGVRSNPGRRLWPNGRIPFVLPEDHPRASAIQAAMLAVQQNTPLRFEARQASDQDYLLFEFRADCGCGIEGIGKMGGPQKVFVGAQCGLGNVIHLLGHAAGLLHEHNRPDRDRFVTVHPDRIQQPWVSQFETHREVSEAGLSWGDYDFQSIMHARMADPHIGLEGGEPYLTVLEGRHRIGQRVGLSGGDIRKVGQLYQVGQATSQGGQGTTRRAIDIRYSVDLLGQPAAMSCWATAAAMIVSWRDEVVIRPEEIAEGAGYWSNYVNYLNADLDRRYMEQYFSTAGLPGSDLNMFEAWSLVPETRLNFTLEDVVRLLDQYGPLWVATEEDLSGTRAGHARVVTGVSGDGTPEGTLVHIHDPWDRHARRFDPRSNRGSTYTETFLEFATKMQRLISRETQLPAGSNGQEWINDAIYVAHP